MKERLTKSDWLQHGLRTLASNGPGALKVGPMSRTLNVSRGSFYWHFPDIAAFRSQLLRCWQERATEQVIQEIDAEGAARLRLNHLVRRGFSSDRRLDRAVRAWAAQDDGVARIVASVDTRRVDYIAKLLIADGVGRQQALPRAAFMYWAYLGQSMDMAHCHTSIALSAMDDISELFRGRAAKRR